jgi:hypothetical protein
VIHNFRNFDYVTKTDFHPRWETKTVHLSNLRGAGLATNWVGRIGIALTKLPANMVSLGVSATKYVVTPGISARKPHFPTSIDTLSPKNPFVRTMNTILAIRTSKGWRKWTGSEILSPQ